MSAPVTRNLTILLTDIQGFTDKTSHKSRVEIQELLEGHQKVVLPILTDMGGRLIKTIGDAFLMVYESPTDAVLAGVAVQEKLAKHNVGLAAEERLEVRIAINSGEVNLAENDIFGEPVNITARIEGVAEAGEVYFTEAVYLAMNKKEVPSSEVGHLQLKGIPEKVRVYKVRREQPLAGEAGGKNLWDRLKDAPLIASAPQPKASLVAPAAGGRPAPAWRRAVALFADGILCTILGSVATGIFSRDKSEPSFVTVDISAAVPASPRVWSVGDTVLGRWEDGRWYAGRVVEAKGGGRYKVRFHDGDESELDAARLAPENIRPGDKVFSRWRKGDSHYYSGVVAKRVQDTLSIDFDDGDQADVPLAAVQLERPGQEAQIAIGDEGVRVQGGSISVPIPAKAGKGGWSWASSIVWVLYGTLFVGILGATPGKKLMGLRVETAAGGPPAWKHAFLRALGSILSSVILFLGYLWALWEKDRRGWHDIIAGTRVVSD